MLKWFRQFLFSLSLLLLIYSCENCSKKSNGAKAVILQDSTIYSKQNYSDLILDSCFINEQLENDKSTKAFIPDILAFYQRRNYQAAWFMNGVLTNSASNFLSMAKDYEEGFQDSSLHISSIQAIIEQQGIDAHFLESNQREKMLLEIKLTSTFFRYAKKAYLGTDKNPKDLEWYIPRKKKSYETLIDSLVTDPQSFDKYEPISRMYKRLKAALIQYRNIEKQGGFPKVNIAEKKLSFGDSSTAITALKKYFTVSGDYTSTDTSWHYTDELQTAVIRFQKRMGLKPDGIVANATIREVNIPVSERIRQIMINMERLRWMPDDLPSEYFIVNIPEFRLHIFDNRKYVWSSDVVVGKQATSTVIFSGILSMVAFSPYWNVPQSIIRNEILPILKRNPGYLNKANMEAVRGNTVLNPRRINWRAYRGSVPFTIRQKPGPENSLGLVKFLFPNSYNIYLHDTPAKTLFAQNNRALSHGCIRVSEAERLANYIFRNDTVYTSDSITKLMNAGVEQTIKLKEPIPVFICYFTTWIDHNGVLNFRKDIYEHDAKLAKEIFGN